MLLLKIFIVFSKISVLAFGGAYSFLPLIEHEVVENHHWLGKPEFLEIAGLTKLFPGAISIKFATYTGRPQDALQYCDKLTTLAGNDSMVINSMAVVYYENAKYKEAEPLMQRALAIDEASLGKDHPKVAIRLNNLAQLYKATNRLKEAEPLMQRALAIFEKSLGPEHPNTKTVRRNLDNLK